MSYLFWLDLKKPVKGVFDIQKKPDGKTIFSGGGGGGGSTLLETAHEILRKTKGFSGIFRLINRISTEGIRDFHKVICPFRAYAPNLKLGGGGAKAWAMAPSPLTQWRGTLTSSRRPNFENFIILVFRKRLTEKYLLHMNFFCIIFAYYFFWNRL